MRMCKSGRHDMDVCGQTPRRSSTSGPHCRGCKRDSDRERQRRLRDEQAGNTHVPMMLRLDESGGEELIVWGAGSDSSYVERPGHRRAWLTAATDWMEDGACNGVDPELFFSDSRGDEAPMIRETENGEKKIRATAAAKLVCQRCPVISQCAEYALRWHEEYGVWGGMSAQERKRRWREEEAHAAVA